MIPAIEITNDGISADAGGLSADGHRGAVYRHRRRSRSDMNTGGLVNDDDDGEHRSDGSDGDGDNINPSNDATMFINDGVTDGTDVVVANSDKIAVSGRRPGIGSDTDRNMALSSIVDVDEEYVDDNSTTAGLCGSPDSSANRQQQQQLHTMANQPHQVGVYRSFRCRVIFLLDVYHYYYYHLQLLLLYYFYSYKYINIDKD